jgi:hypothetical protein
LITRSVADDAGQHLRLAAVHQLGDAALAEAPHLVG